MSNFAYITPDFEISRAQAIQAFGARCDITPEFESYFIKNQLEIILVLYI